MKDLFNSKKGTLSFLGMLIIGAIMIIQVVITPAGEVPLVDMAVLMGALSAIISSFNIGQGIADRGKTAVQELSKGAN